MGVLGTVLTVLVILVVLYLVLSWLFSGSNQLSSLQDGNVKTVISAGDLPSNNQTSNYTYSTWFYVQDWNYRFGEPKILLARLDQDRRPSPSIVLGAMENTITISVSCYPTAGSSGITADRSIVHKCDVRNFPLQKWVNLLISMNGQSLDVYVDGKLFRTCVLPGVAKVNPDASIVITPDGGFQGWTANTQYWDKPTNPQQAYNIYKAGFGGGSLGDLFNKYRIRVEFLEDNQVEGSFEI